MAALAGADLIGRVRERLPEVRKMGFEVRAGTARGPAVLGPTLAAPVAVGALAAGAVAVGVGFSVNWHVALLAGLVVFAVRMLEDYVVVPKVLGHAVGLSPLVVLVAVTALGLLLGGIYVLLAIPLAAIAGTLVDVIVRDRDPAEEEVPTVIFSAQENETIRR